MSLSLITGVASLAMKFGPSAIRGVSSLFGGSDTAEKVASAVEEADRLLGANNAQKEQAVVSALQSLPPESMVELEALKVELEKQETRRMELELSDRQAEHRETQVTIRAGDSSEDEYVRRARPKGCLRGLNAAIAYVFMMEGLSAFDKGTGASWEIAAGLIAPFLTYLGWRSADKRGITPGSGTMVGDVMKVLKRK